MQVYTDNVDFGGQLVAGRSSDWVTPPPQPGPEIAVLIARLFGERAVYHASVTTTARWPLCCAVSAAEQSQFDALVKLRREGIGLPDGVVCVAGAGRGFHGLRARPWSATPGNIHLSLMLAPPRETIRTPVDLLAWAAVSVVETIDGIPGLERRAGIKWVNDILIDGAKVCGILTHVETRDDGMVAVVGIGLNVETVPAVDPTPFVPRVAALAGCVPDPAACRQGPVLDALLAALDRNYARLLAGDHAALVARYRERSLVLGCDVVICAEHSPEPVVVARGRAVRLGDRLELYLEGHERPFTTGRLMLPADP